MFHSIISFVYIFADETRDASPVLEIKFSDTTDTPNGSPHVKTANISPAPAIKTTSHCTYISGLSKPVFVEAPSEEEEDGGEGSSSSENPLGGVSMKLLIKKKVKNTASSTDEQDGQDSPVIRMKVCYCLRDTHYFL